MKSLPKEDCNFENDTKSRGFSTNSYSSVSYVNLGFLNVGYEKSSDENF